MSKTKQISMKFKLKNLTVLPLMALALACGSTDKEGEPATNSALDSRSDFQVYEKGTVSQYTATANFEFSNFSEWSNHYALHRGNRFDSRNAPYIDFSRENVLAIHLGSRSHAGYSINILSVSDDNSDSTTQIRYEEVIDNTNANAQVISYPYAFVRIHYTDREIRFIKTGTRSI